MDFNFIEIHGCLSSLIHKNNHLRLILTIIRFLLKFFKIFGNLFKSNYFSIMDSN
jgi:hypothetical protein